jgi:preprotein translocase subunit SecA
MPEFGIPPGVGVLRQMITVGKTDRPVDLQFHLSQIVHRFTRGTAERLRRKDMTAFARRADWLRRRMAGVSDAELLQRADRYKVGAAASRPVDEAMAKLTAIVAIMAERHLGLRPYRSQLAGAGVLLSGGIAEMETGAGKTLTAAIAAVVAVLSGERVHLITANDYLAARDAAWLKDFYAIFGLSSGVITHEVPPAERSSVYAAAIVYGSNKEIAFDYLRNRITLGSDSGAVRLALQPLHDPSPRSNGVTMRGLPFAIVDEADSVLVDECRTPLIISETRQPDPDWASIGHQLAADLEPRVDFELQRDNRQIKLTSVGKSKLAKKGEKIGGVWRNMTRREHAAAQALAALHLFHRDEHYVVQNDKIELIDEYTGRTAEDRSLGDGLHQMIEAKEKVTITGQRETMGRITYQTFFRRYRRLAGMTGTAREITGELASVYGVQVTTVRSAYRTKRRFLIPRIYRSEDAKLKAVVQKVRRLQARGQPVLVATRTIRTSLCVSEALTEAMIEHSVLNATQDAHEGDVIAQAGQLRRVTVATNMAGRGVDIKLGDDVVRLGGLHVILTELHEAGRIDRQVFGRCARQGDRGSVQTMLSWSDPLIETFGGWKAKWRMGHLFTFLKAQRRAEALHARARLDLLKQDQNRETRLKFTGTSE